MTKQVTIDVPDAWERLLLKSSQRSKRTVSDLVMERGVKEIVRREAVDAIDAMITAGEEIPPEVLAAAEAR